MSNQDYWQQRAERNLQAVEDIAVDYNLELAKEYKKVIKELQEELMLFYAKYAEENKISLEMAKKRLSGKELSEFKEIIQDYIEQASQYDTKNAQSYLKNLKELQDRARLSRLELLIAEYRHAIEMLLLKQEDQQPNIYLQGYEDMYYHTLYDVQTYSGVGMSFITPSKDLVISVLSQNYLGEDFSDRLWKNKEMQFAFAAGKSSSYVADKIASAMNTRQGVTMTLVRTEMNNIANQAALQAYIQAGIKEYQLLATLDFKTSEICISMDGRIFKVSKAERGVNFPPFHPNCRTTTVPVVDGQSYAQRIAKEENYYIVDKNISYKQWLKEYVNK